MMKEKFPRSLFFVAVKRGDTDRVQELLLENPSREILNEALHAAVYNAQKEIIDLLLPLSDPTHRFSYPLEQASANGNMDFVDTLLPLSKPENPRCLALAMAAEYGHLDIVYKLIPISHPNHYSEGFVRAAKGGYLSIVEVLFPLADSAFCAKALYGAAEGGHVEVVQFLLPHYTYKATDLSIARESFRDATRGGFSEIIRLLVPFMDRTTIEKALYSACFYKNNEIFDILYPLTNSRVVLSQMTRDGLFGERLALLEERIFVEDTKKLLKEGTERYHKAAVRKLKGKL